MTFLTGMETFQALPVQGRPDRFMTFLTGMETLCRDP